MSQRKHILVVDADGGIRDTIAAILEDRGYRVSCVPDGVSMRYLLENDEIDQSLSTPLCEARRALLWPNTLKRFGSRWS